MIKLNGFEIQNSIEEKCWKLSSYILSQYDFQYLSHPANEYWCIFENKFKESFTTVFFKELIELAGLLRALLDSEPLTIEIQNNDNSFGVLKKETGETIKLSYRDVCNKIIHAISYEVKFNFSERHPLDNTKNGYGETVITEFKNPKIITQGSLKGKQWNTEIDFLKFIDQTMNLQIQ
jgi:hypothetical protein